MLFDYFKSLNWNILSSDIWREFVRGASLSLDDVVPNIQTVRNSYLSWKNPNDFAGSRGIVRLPGESDDSFYNRIINAYFFWKNIHNPLEIEKLLGCKVNEYPEPNQAEFSLIFSNTISSEQLEEILQFIHIVKPARSRFKGVIMSDTFLVSKDHTHTGGDDGQQINHQSLTDKGSMSHQQLENSIADLHDEISSLGGGIITGAELQELETNIVDSIIKERKHVKQNYTELENNSYWVGNDVDSIYIPLFSTIIDPTIYTLNRQQNNDNFGFSFFAQAKFTGRQVSVSSLFSRPYGYGLRLRKYTYNIDSSISNEILVSEISSNNDGGKIVMSVQHTFVENENTFMIALEGLGLIFYDRYFEWQPCILLSENDYIQP